MYRPTQINDIQSSRENQLYWYNENIYETYLQHMYGGRFKNPKKLHDKRVTVTNKNLEIHGACRHKTTFHQFNYLLF